MHGFEETGARLPDDPTDRRPWYRLLTRYHWFVLVVAALGWLFDCLDQQLFIIARNPAIGSLLPKGTAPDVLKEWGGNATAIFTSSGKFAKSDNDSNMCQRLIA